MGPGMAASKPRNGAPEATAVRTIATYPYIHTAMCAAQAEQESARSRNIDVRASAGEKGQSAQSQDGNKPAYPQGKCDLKHVNAGTARQ